MYQDPTCHYFRHVRYKCGQTRQKYMYKDTNTFLFQPLLFISGKWVNSSIISGEITLVTQQDIECVVRPDVTVYQMPDVQTENTNPKSIRMDISIFWRTLYLRIDIKLQIYWNLLGSSWNEHETLPTVKFWLCTKRSDSNMMSNIKRNGKWYNGNIVSNLNLRFHSSFCASRSISKSLSC